MELLRSIAIFIGANAIGIAAAALYLGPGFQLGIVSFVVAVLVFTAVEAAAKPLLERASRKWLPQMIGALSLVAVFVSLLVTTLLVPGSTISGIGSWLAATLIVWLVSFLAQLALAKWAFPAATPDTARKS
jgi:drug/metabolite transporter (DMT)-like permease